MLSSHCLCQSECIESWHVPFICVDQLRFWSRTMAFCGSRLMLYLINTSEKAWCHPARLLCIGDHGDTFIFSFILFLVKSIIETHLYDLLHKNWWAVCWKDSCLKECPGGWGKSRLIYSKHANIPVTECKCSLSLATWTVTLCSPHIFFFAFESTCTIPKSCSAS